MTLKEYNLILFDLHQKWMQSLNDGWEQFFIECQMLRLKQHYSWYGDE